MLELSNISKSFGGVKAVEDVSLFFGPGKIFSLVGPNGAGKTTIFNLINGLLRPDSGEIVYKEESIVSLQSYRIAHLGIGRLFQDIRLFEKLSCIENVLLAEKNNPGENPLNVFFAPKKINSSETKNTESSKYWLDFVGLSGKEDTLAENLSYGQQKLLSLARLMAGDFDYLLLDEPTAGINPAMIDTILDLIKRIVREEGKTVIFIEHNMSIVLKIADWVYFLEDGKVSTFGIPRDVLTNPAVREAYTGL